MRSRGPACGAQVRGHATVGEVFAHASGQQKNFRTMSGFAETGADPVPRMGALTGIRVVDLTRVLAGPTCAMMLGDMGADVIKVEPPTGGDDTRGWGPPFAGGESAYYLCANRNKRSMTLNLASPAGQKVLTGLIHKADVVVDNFKLGTMAKWGF